MATRHQIEYAYKITVEGVEAANRQAQKLDKATSKAFTLQSESQQRAAESAKKQAGEMRSLASSIEKTTPGMIRANVRSL